MGAQKDFGMHPVARWQSVLMMADIKLDCHLNTQTLSSQCCRERKAKLGHPIKRVLIQPRDDHRLFTRLPALQRGIESQSIDRL